MAAVLFGLSPDEWKLALMSFHVVIWFVIALVLAIIFYKIARGAFRLARMAGGVFGENISSKLISLGLAAAIFPNVIPGIIFCAASFVYSLIEKMPNTLVFPLDMSAPMDPGRVGETFIRLFGTMLWNWSQVFINAFRIFWEVPIKDAILMLGTGAVFGLIFREVERVAEPGSLRTSELWLVHYFRSMPSRSRQNLVFVLILAIAGYLSIAAIAAIPALTESSGTGTDFSSEKLKQRLDSLREESESELKEFKTAENPFKELRQIQDSFEPPQPLAPGTQPLALSPPEKLALKDSLNSATEEWRGRLKAHTDLVLRAKKQNVDDANWLIGEYQANTVERKGRREAVRYYYDMANYYRLSVGNRQAQVERSAEDFERFVQDARQWDSEGAARAKNAAAAGAASGTTLTDFLYRRTVLTAPQRRPDQDRYEAAPTRPELGSYLGPFQLVASWLLRTESLSLALIVGMIGFGLLGAASSSFIREKSENGRADQPLVQDLSGVIIRGCSAAVVVFLAAKGGLAIFGSGAADPNPYVLLLTCLVAAVFSDAVWDRAQDWFKKLGEKRKERQRLAGHANPAKRSEKATRSTARETAAEAG